MFDLGFANFVRAAFPLFLQRKANTPRSKGFHAAPAARKTTGALLAAIVLWFASAALAQAACTWNVTFSAVGETKSIYTNTCETPLYNEYGSFYDNPGSIFNLFGLGASNSGAPTAEDRPGLSGGNYRYVFNINTSKLDITMLTAPPSGSDSFTGYMIVGATDADPDPQANTPATIYFAYVPPPTVTGVSPNSGSIQGNTIATLTGANFTGATGVSFGGAAATDVTVVSATSITARVPAHAQGFVNVVVSNAGGTGTLTNGYTYVAYKPVANAVSATVSANSSNNPITLNITGYAATSVAIASQGSKGTATASGTAITYTPTANQSGSDSFTYTAKNADGTSAPATVSITIDPLAPDAPTIGSAYAGDTQASVTFTAPLNNGGSAVTLYTATSSPGGLVGWGSSSPVTVTGLTNGTSYTFTVTATNSLGTGTASAATNAVTPKASQTITFGNPGPRNFGTTPTLTATSTSSLPVAFSSSTTSVCTITSGGDLTFVSAGTCTIQADQPGDGVYLPATTVSQTFTVVPVVAGAPTIGTAIAYDGIATVSFSPPSANGGDPVFGYTVTANPGGATGTGSASPIEVGGLTNGVAYTFTVTATNSAGTGSASAASNSVTPKGVQTISFANPGAQNFGTTPTLTATSTSNLPVSFSSSTTGICTITTGGALNFVSTGTCTINADQAGDSTYLAATTVTRSFTVFAVVPGAPTSVTATAGNGEATVTFTAPASNGGSSVTTYTVTSNPGGIVGTSSSSPITVDSLTNGTDYTFTVTATNSAGTGASSAASNSVRPAAAPTAGPVSLTVAANSTANNVVLNLSGAAATSVAIITAPAHGSAVATGTAVTYTPSPGYSGSDSFTYSASNSGGTSSTATVSITVTPPPVSYTFSPAAGALPEGMAGEQYSAQITASGGVAPVLYSVASGALPPGMILNVSTGALSGPLDAASEGDYAFMILVRDTNGAADTANYTLHVKPRAVTVVNKTVDVPAGSTPLNVDLTAGATGGPFTSADLTLVEPSNAGTARIVNGEFAQAGGSGSVGWYLKFIPNPAYSGQVQVGYRLTSALGASNTGVVTYNLGYDAGEVAADIDALVHGFVQTRQGLLASAISPPGLIERRRMAAAMDPVIARLSPSGDGVMMNFSTSLAQVNASSAAVEDAVGQPAEQPAFNVWMKGMLAVHNRPQNDNRWGTFGVVSVGADYLVNDKTLVGLSFHYDRMTDPTDADTEVTGNGWLAGPYASLEIGDGVFWDTSLLYGASSNTINTTFWDGTFDTKRWLFDTAISGQWKLDEITTVTPKLRAVYLSETVSDYAVVNGGGDVLDIRGFTEEQLRVSLGAEIARQIALENGAVLIPTLGATFGFAGLEGTGAFAQVNGGLSYQPAEDWAVEAGLLLGITGDGQKSVGAKIGVTGRF